MATSGVQTNAMGDAAAEFQRVTEEAFQAQMIVAQAQVIHGAKSGVANAIGQTGAQVGQDIRQSAKQQ